MRVDGHRCRSPPRGVRPPTTPRADHVTIVHFAILTSSLMHTTTTRCTRSHTHTIGTNLSFAADPADLPTTPVTELALPQVDERSALLGSAASVTLALADRRDVVNCHVTRSRRSNLRARPRRRRG